MSRGSRRGSRRRSTVSTLDLVSRKGAAGRERGRGGWPPVPLLRPRRSRRNVVARALDASKAIYEPIVLNPTPARRAAPCVSVLGPSITGEGAMARLTFHAGYHHGQAYQIKNAPGFPMNL